MNKSMSQVQFIVDGQGNRTSAIIPFHEWEILMEQYRKLQNKVNVLQGIKDSLKEIKQANISGKQLQTLDDFLFHLFDI
jgi:hypothetical protein